VVRNLDYNIEESVSNVRFLRYACVWNSHWQKSTPWSQTLRKPWTRTL